MIREHFDPVLITPPNSEPLDIGEVKKHLRIEEDTTADDDYLQSLLIATRQRLEAIQPVKLITQTWKIFYDRFPSWAIDLPFWPLQSVTHVKYYDANNIQQTIDPANYQVSIYGIAPQIAPVYGQIWPLVYLRLNAVEIQVVVGFGEPKDVPEELKHRLKFAVGRRYENRVTIAPPEEQRMEDVILAGPERAIYV